MILKILYEFKDNAISILNKAFEDLEIDDIVKASGGMIVEDASQLCNKKDLIFFSEQISKNISLWHEHKQKLYDSTIFEHDSYNQQRIYIHTNNLSKEENKLLNLILDNLVKMKEIALRNTTDKITIDFLNNYLKAFIFKSGTWLEIETNKLINKIFTFLYLRARSRSRIRSTSSAPRDSSCTLRIPRRCRSCCRKVRIFPAPL